MYEEAKRKAKFNLEILPGDLVQITFGDLNGIKGKVLQKRFRVVKMKVLCKPIKGMVISEVEDYVQKYFK